MKNKAIALLAMGTLALTACSTSEGSKDGGGSGGASGASGGSTVAADPTDYRCDAGQSVTVVTHDSFVMDDALKKAFTAKTGCALKVVTQGDAGVLTNKLVLTKNNPLGDVTFGLDNTYGGRAVKEGVLTEWSPQLPPGAEDKRLDGAGADELTPIDFGDVCINVDDDWFAKHQKNPPKSLDDLTKPDYKDLFVTPGASTSSPGMAFLLTTIAAKGGPDSDGWKQYWKDLMANGAKVTQGWTDAYSVDFSGGEGKGTRPIVLSYASSPPFTIPKGGDKPTTSALLDTCFRQVEYAGVLKGAKNEKGAKAFIQFLLTPQFQASIPDAMYMYPVDSQTKLPELWAKFAKVSDTPYAVPADVVESKRASWLADWTDITTK